MVNNSYQPKCSNTVELSLVPEGGLQAGKILSHGILRSQPIATKLHSILYIQVLDIVNGLLHQA